MNRIDRHRGLLAATGSAGLFLLGLGDVQRAFGWQFALIVLLALAGAAATLGWVVVFFSDARQFRRLARDREVRRLQVENDRLNATGSADLSNARQQEATIAQLKVDLFDRTRSLTSCEAELKIAIEDRARLADALKQAEAAAAMWRQLYEREEAKGKPSSSTP